MRGIKGYPGDIMQGSSREFKVSDNVVKKVLDIELDQWGLCWGKGKKLTEKDVG